MPEITKTIKLDEEQTNMVDFHSFFNICNILSSELYLLGCALGDEAMFEELSNIFVNSARDIRLGDKVENLKKLKGVDILILAKINKKIQENGFILNDEANTSYDNIKSIFEIFKVRLEELIERVETPLLWKFFLVDDLKQRFLNVFSAIEKNSKGRYRIIYNIAEHETEHYLFHVNLSSLDNHSIFMPAVLQDIMRDLIANARKYTKPGGTIDAGLVETESEITFAVKDTGIGIPAVDIEKVVEFGFRAANAKAKPTYGGGFGLTKAYFFIKELGGRFWINSEIENGTEIKFTIPKKEL